MTAELTFLCDEPAVNAAQIYSSVIDGRNEAQPPRLVERVKPTTRKAPDQTNPWR
jgi:hypothetical protein